MVLVTNYREITPNSGRTFVYGGSPMSLNGIFEAVCIIGVFPIIVWLSASGITTDNTSRRICRFLGDISFPLYMVHYPLMYAFYMWLIKTELNG
ncbi:acyltransferase family protein [Prevotella sp.]|uniref:acyltransferase family protein n=1 Tax=Prevotella sp. TaxID=59823 RepID=UPI0025CFBBF5|nr:acyltransferase family protein [Prevotella sp.]